MARKRFVAIVNPASGRRQAPRVLEQIKPIFTQADAELDIRFCERSRHASELARSMHLDGYDGCCVLGGDGTVHEVVNGFMQRDDGTSLPLGLIPAGTGNTLHLHQGGLNAEESAKRILAGATCPLDVARLKTATDTIYCINIVGWGGVVDINSWAERLRFLGPMRYLVATLGFALSPTFRSARLTIENQAYEDDFLLVIGCVTKYTGNGMLIAPRAVIDDGKIDLVVVRKVGRCDLWKLFRRVASGEHLDVRGVEYHQVARFSIELSDQKPLDLDGEATGSAPFEVEMIPSALRLFT